MLLRRLLAALPLVACTAQGTSPPAPVASSTSPTPVPSPPMVASAPAPPPLPPASTLPTDLTPLTATARTRFGPAARIQTAGTFFVLVEAGPPSPSFLDAAALLDRAIPRLLPHFPRHPDRGVTVLAFTKHDAFTAACAAGGCDPDGDFGAYSPARHEIVVDVSGGKAFLPTFLHEAVHPLLEADFPDIPDWFAEGITSLFEAPVFGADGGLGGVDRNWRDAQLRPLLATADGRARVRLDGLFGMMAKEWNGRLQDAGASAAKGERALHYAMARSVCAWLDGQGELWPFYAAWRDGYADDPSGERAFTRVLGASPKEMNGAWQRWER